MNYVSLKYPLSYDALLPNGITNKTLQWHGVVHDLQKQE